MCLLEKSAPEEARQPPYAQWTLTKINKLASLKINQSWQKKEGNPSLNWETYFPRPDLFDFVV